MNNISKKFCISRLDENKWRIQMIDVSLYFLPLFHILGILFLIACFWGLCTTIYLIPSKGEGSHLDGTPPHLCTTLFLILLFYYCSIYIPSFFIFSNKFSSIVNPTPVVNNSIMYIIFYHCEANNQTTMVRGLE